jgi:copper resistance protein D
MVALEAVVSGIDYAALALFLGVLVTAGFLLPAGAPKTLRKPLVASAGIWLLAFLTISALALSIEGAKLQGAALPSLETLLRYLTLTQIGKAWLWRECYGAGLVLIVISLLRGEAKLTGVRLLVFLALPLLASRSLTSHAVAAKEDRTLAVAVDAIHLIATGFWGGGLLALFWTLYRGTKKLSLPLPWAAEVVRRFSLLAIVSVAAVLVSGLYQSWIQVGTPRTLFTTDYGQVLLVKLVLFLGMLALGTLNLLSTKPRLLRATHENREEFSTVKKALTRIGAESSLALLIFFVTGLLTALPPGIHAVHQVALANPSHNESTPGQLAPAEGASVKILLPVAGQTFASDTIPLSFKLTKGKRGDHVHAYVDGELLGMFMSKQGTLNGVKPGRHVLELRVVAEDHQTELDARDRIEFIVRDEKEEKK